MNCVGSLIFERGRRGDLDFSVSTRRTGDATKITVFHPDGVMNLIFTDEELRQTTSAGRKSAEGLDRPTRLRWLAGSQSVSEAWDAYEAVNGMPLSDVTGQEWSVVREWLHDLTDEIHSGSSTSAVPLSVDHVWIGLDGRVRLLDWPAAKSREQRLWKWVDGLERRATFPAAGG
jgi:hypothetical protein